MKWLSVAEHYFCQMVHSLILCCDCWIKIMNFMILMNSLFEFWLIKRVKYFFANYPSNRKIAIWNFFFEYFCCKMYLNMKNIVHVVWIYQDIFWWGFDDFKIDQYIYIQSLYDPGKYHPTSVTLVKCNTFYFKVCNLTL